MASEDATTELGILQLVQQTQPTKQHPDRIVKTVAVVTLVGAVVVLNLDKAGDWFTGTDNLLEASCCYQLMTSANDMLGFHNWRLCTAWSNLAHCYSRLGRRHDAVHAARKARELMADLSGEVSANVAVLDAQTAECMYKAKDYKGAEALLGSALKTLDSLHGNDKKERVYILTILTDTYLAEKRFDKAAESAKQMIAIEDQLLAEQAWTRFDGRPRLIEAYCKANKLTEANSAADDGLKLAEKNDSLMVKAGAHDCLGRVYVAKGDVNSARAQFDQALVFLGQEYPDNAQKVASWQAFYNSVLKDKNPYPD